MAKRNTHQRRAIREVFEALDRPLSTQEVLEAARAQRPGLGIATVYRTLKILLDEGWLCGVQLPGQPPRYERAGKPRHHHFSCGACGRVYEVLGALERVDALVPRGFKLERHELVLYGRCSTCLVAVG